MMKKIYLFIISIFIFYGCSSDNEPENCLAYKHAKITNVEMDVLTVQKNHDLPITVSFFIENSCGSFNDFEVIRNGKIYDIKLKAKYEGCVCNEIAAELETTYYFRATETGFYTLNFSVSNTEYITKVVQVE